MAEKTDGRSKRNRSFSYVTVPYTSISDSTVKVTDDDVKAYMNKHQAEFKQEEEARGISYVTFDAFPNAEDSAAALNTVTNLKPEFQAATDPAAYLARVSSETPYLDAYILGSKHASTKCR